jgi:muconolactone delta-isomerase
MAKNKPESGGEFCDVTREKITAVVDDIRRAKEKASELTGSAGAASKNACEQYNIPKGVLASVVKLSKMDPAQAEQFIGASLKLWATYGLFDQVDMFTGDQMVETLEDILAKLKNTQHNGPADEDAEALAGMVA